jgi:hypothetical protein
MTRLIAAGLKAAPALSGSLGFAFDFKARDGRRPGSGCATAGLNRHLRLENPTTVAAYTRYEKAIYPPLFALFRARSAASVVVVRNPQLRSEQGAGRSIGASPE